MLLVTCHHVEEILHTEWRVYLTCRRFPLVPAVFSTLLMLDFIGTPDLVIQFADRFTELVYSGKTPMRTMSQVKSSVQWVSAGTNIYSEPREG